jgi:hypothetical protein
MSSLQSPVMRRAIGLCLATFQTVKFVGLPCPSTTTTTTIAITITIIIIIIIIKL